MAESIASVRRVRHEGGSAVHVSGEVDMSNANAVGMRILELRGDDPGVIIDLSEVVYFDSQGLLMLDRLAKRLASARAELSVVAAPGSPVGRLLAMTGMDAQLNVRPSLS